LPADDEFEAEANQLRRIILMAADSTINQVLQIEAGLLNKPPSDDMERVFEERRRKALEAIEKLEEGIVS
jgi:hypothetical protein